MTTLSEQVTQALGSDDWLILHDGHHLVTADELDGLIPTLSAGGVSPTAPDEHETLRKEASDYIHKKRPEWHDNGVGIVQGSHYRSGFVDGAEWACFRRSREATTEPQPITDADVDVAARVMANLNGVEWEDVDTWGFSWQEFRDGYYAKARAALEAVEASRSPKPTEVER